MKGLGKLAVTDKKVIMGAGIGLGVALLVEKFLPDNLKKDPNIKMASMALAPGLVAGFMMKDKTAVAAAAATGLGVGLVDKARTMLNDMGKKPAAPALPSSKNPLEGFLPEPINGQVGEVMEAVYQVSGYEEDRESR